LRRRLAVFLCCVALAAPAGAQHPQPHGSTFTGFIFGDVTYVATERDLPGGFLVGQLVGHGNAHLSERLLFFGELSATARETGYAFEVERAILRYEFTDAFKLSAGRYHTPVSYWNVMYHHGLWLQPSVARPELIRMGGFLIPVHFVGAMAEGMLVTRPVTFFYEAGVGNGRGTALNRGGDAGDVNSSRAALATLRLRPATARALQVGGGFYADRLTTTAFGPIDERTVTAHVAWDQGAPEVMAEFARVRHEAASASSTSDAWYVHAGIRLPGGLSSWRPYVRIEHMDIGAGLVLGSIVPDYRAAIAGVRWDFEALASLKGEVRSESFAGGERQPSLYLQASFVIPSMRAF
jgi:hypothetical protein